MNPGDHVKYTYREGCANYTYGFALAFASFAILVAAMIIFNVGYVERFRHVFILFVSLTFGTTLSARYAPVRFYELMEGEYEPEA